MQVKQVILMKLSAIGAEARYGLGINEQHTPLTHLIQKTSNKLVGNLQNVGFLFINQSKSINL